MAKRNLLTRRDFIKAAGVGVVAAGVAPTIFIPRYAHGASKELKILVWSHFVPRFDKEWYDGFAKKWGEANGIHVTVDHIGLAEIPSRTAAEISAGQGHDLIEWIAPPSQFEPSVLDLGDVVMEAEKLYGKQHPLCRRSSYNPNTKKFYAFCPGWTIDPGCYRKSLWDKAGKGAGPTTWEDLITYGGKIKRDQGIQLGIGLSQELDSNMAARALLWSYDSEHPGHEGERGPEQPEDRRGGRLHGPPVQGGDGPRGVLVERGVEQPGAHRRPRFLHPELHLGVPLRAEGSPRDRQGHLLHPRPQGTRRNRVQLRARDLHIHRSPEGEEHRERQEVPPQPGRELRSGDVRERALQLSRLLRRPNPFREPRLRPREGRQEAARPPQRLVLERPVRPPRRVEGEARRPQGRREVEHQPRASRPGEPGRRRGLRDLRPAEHDGEGRPRRQRPRRRWRRPRPWPRPSSPSGARRDWSAEKRSSLRPGRAAGYLRPPGHIPTRHGRQRRPWGAWRSVAYRNCSETYTPSITSTS